MRDQSSLMLQLCLLVEVYEQTHSHTVCTLCSLHCVIVYMHVYEMYKSGIIVDLFLSIIMVDSCLLSNPHYKYHACEVHCM